MLLSELVPDDVLLPAAPSAMDIRGLTADSRAVRPGFLFAALAGSRTDGSRFVAEAVARGAVAVLAAPGGAQRHAHPSHEAHETAAERLHDVLRPWTNEGEPPELTV